jgi:hypothetical protein
MVHQLKNIGLKDIKLVHTNMGIIHIQFTKELLIRLK